MTLRGGPLPEPPRAKPAAPADETAQAATKTININVRFNSLPKLPRLSKKALAAHTSRLFSTKKAITTSLAIVAVLGLLAVNSLLHQQPATGNSDSPTSVSPHYQTALPGGKSISQLGGWKRISPPGKEPVFAYADSIGTVPISVSQQQLPASWKDNTDDQVAELAKKFNATDKIDGGGTKIYIGTSAKGPQSAILTKKNLLILIKSQRKIEDAAWQAYVGTLN